MKYSTLLSLLMFLFLSVGGSIVVYSSSASLQIYDLDKSGEIDAGDLLIIMSLMGGGKTEADFNDDQETDLQDLFLYSLHWKESVPGDDTPPDPREVAPPLDLTVATLPAVSTAFLYSGTDPVQFEVDARSIVPSRATILRGTVLSPDGSPLAGVRISILSHPEYGYTRTRNDGVFDLVVNGGGEITVNYFQEGFLPAQRMVNTSWQDYVWLPDVVLVPLDEAVTLIQFLEPMEIAQGSIVQDEDGSRQATLLFSSGTSATMILQDGSTHPLPTISVRATEYTVGPNGPAAMPAVLPPSSFYTYAVELSADEALAAGARRVEFDHPVWLYVDNFLNFPTGIPVPVAYYDLEKSAWVPSQDGLVVQVISIQGEQVLLDVEGKGIPSDASKLSSLGITEEERKSLAQLYDSGKSLWRVPIRHFTAYDCNYGVSAQAGSAPPDVPMPATNIRCPLGNICYTSRSIIDRQNQILGQSVPITGTSYSLYYTSSRVPGYIAARSMEIQLSGETIPEVLQEIRLEIQIAGQKYAETFPPEANQTYPFHWNGQDAYGRPVQGQQPITIRIGYVYNAYYNMPPPSGRSFGINSGEPIPGDIRAREQITFWQQFNSTLGAYDARAQGLGGWTLEGHHFYDPVKKQLMRGDGTTQSAGSILRIIETVAGTGEFFSFGKKEGDPAIEVAIRSPYRPAFGPDGSFYVPDAMNSVVWRIDPVGIIHVAAGNQTRGYSGDGGLAKEAQLSNPTGVAFAPDGSLYIADSLNHIVRRVNTQGIISLFAGTPQIKGSTGDFGLATEAFLNTPSDVAVGMDGCVYIADTANFRIRKVSPDGIIQTIAGTGQQGYQGDGGAAIQAVFYSPQALDVGPDGSVYIVDMGNYRLRRIDPDGTIHCAAGNGSSTLSGDGGRALEAGLGPPSDVAVSAEGFIYITVDSANRLRAVSPQGIIYTVAGSGPTGAANGMYAGDGGDPTIARLNRPQGVAIAPNGRLLVSDTFNLRVRAIRSVMPGGEYGASAIPSEDNREIYVFNEAGRHERTLNALSGATLFEFQYDSRGRIQSVVDADGNRLWIERNENEALITLTAPFGQNTWLVLNRNGYALGVINPLTEKYVFEYDPQGLMQQMMDPCLFESEYNYDALGLLQGETDASGGSITLERLATAQIQCVTQTSAEGVVDIHEILNLPSGGKKIINRQGCCGPFVEVVNQTDGSTQTQFANGIISRESLAPDPRFGLQAPLLKNLEVTTPGGLSYVRQFIRNVSLSDEKNPFSMTSMTDAFTIQGKTYQNTYNASTRTWTHRSPLGRITRTTVDEVERPVRLEVQGLDPLQMEYDEHGRMIQVSLGERILKYGYDPASGFLESVTDAKGHVLTFERDLVGRTTQLHLPNNQDWGYEYDPMGRLKAVIQPDGQTAHQLRYSPAGLLEWSRSPGGATEEFHYDRDRRIIRRESGTNRFMDWIYEGGRIAEIRVPEGNHLLSYDDQTGQRTRMVSRYGQQTDYAYDGHLLIHSAMTGWVTGTVSYGFDPNFQINELRYAGEVLPVIYDSDGMMIQVGDIVLTRNASNGLITSLQNDDFQIVYSYNRYAEVVSATMSFRQTPVYAIAYEYDALGHLIARTETLSGDTQRWVYDYDSLGQLLTVHRNGALVESYQYDAVGNRVAVNNTLTQTSLTPSDITYDPDNQLLKAGATTFTYEYGALAIQQSGNQSIHFKYSTEGNLEQVDLPDGRTLTYLYDAMGRRVIRLENSVQTHAWLYGKSLLPLAEYESDGQVRTVFIYAMGYTPISMIRNSHTYHLISDHLGSPRLVLDEDGTVIKRIEYDSYGNVLLDTAPEFDLPFGFCGGMADPAHELIRFGARDYQPSTGRWTAPDPILVAGGPNLYQYARNAPTIRVDRLGLESRPNPECPLTIPEEILETAIHPMLGSEDPREYEADILAIHYAMMAGYHHRGMEGFLITIDKIEKAIEKDPSEKAGVVEPPLFDYKHPPTEQRLKLVEKYGKELEEFRKKMPEFYQKRYGKITNSKKMESIQSLIEE